jgi:uncharacterized protein GlcG (DUF336 family)
MSISLAVAEQLADAALAHAQTLNTRSLAIVVVDTGGHPVLLKRQDGGGYLLPEIAKAKAYGALGMGADTGIFAELAQTNPLFFQGLTVTTGGAMVYSPGGVIIRDGEGVVLGAVGVSGDTGPNDELCALAGINAVGLTGGMKPPGAE